MTTTYDANYPVEGRDVVFKQYRRRDSHWFSNTNSLDGFEISVYPFDYF